jgi:hypothetical protein
MKLRESHNEVRKNMAELEYKMVKCMLYGLIGGVIIALVLIITKL